MKVNEKRIIDSVVLTQEEQTFLLDLANAVDSLCYTHPNSCENCPLSDVYGWDCESFKGIAKKIGKDGGFENENLCS